MAGLYIHIPFCRRKCHYCNFYSLASVKYFDDLVSVLVKEIAIRKGEITTPLETIYFGGGTPSMLKDCHLEMLMETIYKNYSFTKNPEITLEANPEDISKQQLQHYKKNAINRLSIGIQSFFDNELKYLNRIHSAQKAIESVKLSQDEGFNNISIDLIYGLPNATSASWSKNLEQAFQLRVPHLSCYALTVEPNTALDRFIEKGYMKNVSDELFEEQFEILLNKTNELGYQQYEISNFCLDELYAIHNTNYWFGKTYLGIGPSAHSYDGMKRQWNVAHLKKYMDSITKGEVRSESELLTPVQKFNEFVMTRLRTRWGISLPELEKQFGEKFLTHFTGNIKKYLNSGHLQKTSDRITLTRTGKFVSDGIIANLFYDQN